jgi:ABC-type sugar transport system substrate-binding protein
MSKKKEEEMMMKKYLTIVMAALFALVMLAGCTSAGPGSGDAGAGDDAMKEVLANYDPASNEPIQASASGMGVEQLTLGFITMNIQNPYFVACIEGAQAFADKYGHDLTVLDGASSAEKQAQGVESLIAKGCQAIDVRCVDTVAILDSLKAAREAGLDVNTYPPVAWRTSAQEYDEYNMGIDLGTEADNWCTEHFKGEAVEVAYMTQPTVANVMERREGFDKALKENYEGTITVVQESDGSNPDDAMNATESILQAHPDVKVILCVNDAGALGVYEAVTQAGKATDDFFIGGVDGDPEALEKVAEGGIFRCSIAVNMTIQEFGYANMMNLANAAQGKDYLQTVPVLGIAATIDNVEEIRSRTPDYDYVEEFLATYEKGRVAGKASS